MHFSSATAFITDPVKNDEKILAPKDIQLRSNNGLFAHLKAAELFAESVLNYASKKEV